jgi:hypothetical protein
MAELFNKNFNKNNYLGIEILTSKIKNRIFAIKKMKQYQVWSKEEDKRLISLVEKFDGRNWKEIARNLGNRSGIQCCSRYKRIRPGIIKGQWTQKEDEILLNLVNKFGRNWSLLSRYMPSRTGKQIRERFVNSLDPSIKKDKFTNDEDKLLLELYSENGTSWSKIAEFFHNRTADMIKNRFYSCLHKRLYGDYKEQLRRRKRLRLGGCSKKASIKINKTLFKIDSLSKKKNISYKIDLDYNIDKIPQLEKEYSSTNIINRNRDHNLNQNNNSIPSFQNQPTKNKIFNNNMNESIKNYIPDFSKYIHDIHNQHSTNQINFKNIMSQYLKINEMNHKHAGNSNICLNNNNNYSYLSGNGTSVFDIKDVIIQHLLSLNQILGVNNLKDDLIKLTQNIDKSAGL